ncbi:HNH endonuclease signature motif containing protein [Corynebacterium liangguodongii]|uniref:HNH endonuclease n=1 Tax=Corynebacterium liangguodongii TaxID=2079535 RepID=A0A2S0WCS9_9CORY|nr:HNH endonuclease signature motif containing protein [Corynebacterium liangguodongii]AWB83587.1 HNH endonuclease [Corynebacterium liangguodongii]PWB98621.1 HNH endonuclease [Corynebacterium liangguodongii]
MTTEQLAHDIVEAFIGITRHKARMLSAIGRFDEANMARRLGASTTALWLVQRLGLSETTAHEYVKVARAMLGYPLLAEAFSGGALNYSKARLIAPLLSAETERELVDMAVRLGYHELEVALSKLKRNKAEGARSYVRVKPREDGRVRLWGDFSAAEGAEIMAALKIGEGAYSQEQGQEPVSGFGLPLGSALLGSFMGVIRLARANPRSTLRTPGANVNVVMTTDGRAYLPNNLAAPSEAVKNFLSNASYRLTTVDEKGLVLNVGRSRRLATDAQVAALMVMWRGQCAMPGCTHTRFMEVHHITEWAEGGFTDLDNLLPLCSACHALVTEGSVRIMKEHGDIHFLMPDGARFVSRDHGLPERCDNAVTLEEFNCS